MTMTPVDILTGDPGSGGTSSSATSSGEWSSAGTRIANVFCHIWPKPWTGPSTRLPVTVSWPELFAVVVRRSTGRAHDAWSRGARGSGVVMGALRVRGAVRAAGVAALERSGGGGGRERGRLVVVDRNGLVEARQREDLAVMLGEADGQELLPGALCPDEQRHEEADPTAVHVVELAEVEDDRARIAGVDVRGHDRRLAAPGDLAVDPEDRRRALAADVDGGVGHRAASSGTDVVG